MGTWGVHSFDNDDAMEWAAAYQQMGLPVAASTLEVAMSDFQDGTLTADIACRAVAAVEAVAYALGRGSDKARELFAGAPEADQAVAQGLVSQCDHMIMSITGGSELSQLWKDARFEDYKAWTDCLTELRARVHGTSDTPVEVEEASAADTPESGASEPVAPVASATTGRDAQIEDLRIAIAGLEADIEVMRQEMAEGFARLAQRIEGRVQ